MGVGARHSPRRSDVLTVYPPTSPLRATSRRAHTAAPPINKLADRLDDVAAHGGEPMCAGTREMERVLC